MELATVNQIELKNNQQIKESNDQKLLYFLSFFSASCPDVPYLGQGTYTSYTRHYLPGTRRIPVGTVVTVNCVVGFILLGNSTTTTCTSSENLEPELTQNPCYAGNEQSR